MANKVYGSSLTAVPCALMRSAWYSLAWKSIPSQMPIVAAVIPRGNMFDHGMRYSVSVRPYLRTAVPSMTSSQSMTR